MEEINYKLIEKMKVPFNDLSRIHNPIKKSVLNKLDKTINKNEFILGNSIKRILKPHSVNIQILNIQSAAQTEQMRLNLF